jgi:hypothetical protein
MAETKRDWLDVYDDEYRKRGLYILSAHYTPADQMIHVDFAAGFTMTFHRDRVGILQGATEDQVAEVTTTVAGWAIEFPTLDDGVSLAMLLSGKFGSDRWDQEWIQKTLEAHGKTEDEFASAD